MLCSIVGVVSAQALVKAHEGSHADLKWILNLNLRHYSEGCYFGCGIYYNSSYQIVKFHELVPTIVQWYGDYDGRGETLINERELQIGIRLNNISKADAHQYTFSDGTPRWQSSGAVIYVYGRYLVSCNFNFLHRKAGSFI